MVEANDPAVLLPAGLGALAAGHSVATEYENAEGCLTPVPVETLVAVLAALGVDATTPQAVRQALATRRRTATARLLPPCVVTRAGRPHPLPVPEGTELHIELEDGRRQAVPPDGPLPGDLPLGYHTLHARGPRRIDPRIAVPLEARPHPNGPRTARVPLIVTPARLPAPPRAWGFLVQLYSVLSARSWGMGDLGDLAELATWAGSHGAGFLQINPLHAAPPVPPTDPSPYRPATRAFPDPVHLAVDRLPECAGLPPSHRARLDELLAEAASFRHSVLVPNRPGATLQLINRDAVWRFKREALALLHAVPRSPARSDSYGEFIGAGGARLTDHATWCALTESYGPDFNTWPAGLRDPSSRAVAAFRTAHPVAVDFHRWMAWLADSQLADAQQAALAAGMPIGLIHDLAVGAHPDGSDAWALRPVLAAGMSIGSPPDAFNPSGQNWGLPPWRPDALAAAGYLPYRDLLRGLLRHAGGIRIDHVMGLFRLWWIPEGRPPTEGTYVHYDDEAMTGILALEAHRAGAAAIGEDLGTVEPRVRRELAERGVLGTSVLWFERDWDDPDWRDGRPKRPEEWRELCLATLTTHDLPSTAARLTGEHVVLRHRLGLLAESLREEQATDTAERGEWLDLLQQLGLLDGDGDGAGDSTADRAGTADEERTVLALHRFLRRTPARLTGIWLPDTIGDRRPQNLPGTVDEYPNWRLPLADPTGRPVSLDELTEHPRVNALLRALTEEPEPEPSPEPPAPE